MPDTTTGHTELEPITLVFSDSRRFTLDAEITACIWEEVGRGHYSGPAELIHRALDVYFEAMDEPR